MRIKDFAKFIPYDTNVQIFKENALLADILFDFIHSSSYERYVNEEILYVSAEDNAIMIDIE